MLFEGLYLFDCEIEDQNKGFHLNIFTQLITFPKCLATCLHQNVYIGVFLKSRFHSVSQNKQVIPLAWYSQVLTRNLNRVKNYKSAVK